MIIQLTCPDQEGIVAKFTGVIFDAGANILSLEQHVEPEENLFFMRIKLDLSALTELDALEKDIKSLATEFHGKCRIYNADYPLKSAIFVTKESACLYDLLMKQNSGELDMSLQLIISNYNNLKSIANQYDIPFHIFSISDTTKSVQENKIITLLKDNNIEVIILARYMQILTEDFVNQYLGKIINIHHGFLPAFKGKKPYHQAWEKGVKIIGATAHYVTKLLDDGPIIAQDTASVTHQHSPREMIHAGRDIERRVLTAAVKAHLERRIIIHGKRTIIFH